MWKDIKDYEGLYQISDLGQVRSLERYKQNKTKLQLVKGHMVSECIFSNNYRYVNLYKDNKKKIMLIHRLVAIAFIANPEDKPTVDHRDRNVTNNRLDNLKWATMQEQSDNKLESTSKFTITYQDGSIIKIEGINNVSNHLDCHRNTIDRFMRGTKSKVMSSRNVISIIRDILIYG